MPSHHREPLNTSLLAPGDGTTGQGLSRRRVLLTTAGAGLASIAGVGRTRGTATAGEERWRFETTYSLPTSPTVVDGTVYVASCSGSEGNGIAYALDSDSGEEQWRFEDLRISATNERVSVNPKLGGLEVVDGIVYVSGYSVQALDQETGERLWLPEKRGYHGYPTRSSPAVSQGTVYLGNGPLVAAFNAAVGKLRWVEGGPTGGGRVSPLVVDGTVYTGGVYRNLYAYNGETGEERWRVEGQQPILTSPTVSDGTLYVCTAGFMYAIDTESGQERMRYEPKWGILSSPTVADGTVYVGGESYEREGGVVAAFDTAADTEQWRFEPRGVVHSSPTVVGDTLFVGSDDGFLYALDVADGSERWRFEADAKINAAPIVVDGTVYLADTASTVYALDAGVHGSSEDSRVLLGTENHHHVWAEEASADLAPAEFEVELDAAPNPVTQGDEIDVQLTVTNVGDEAGRREVDYDGPGSFETPIELDGGESQTFEVSETVENNISVPAYKWPGKLFLAVRVFEDEAELTIPIEKPGTDRWYGHLSDYGWVGALGGLGGAGYLVNRRIGDDRT
ncbi:PQQ-binding-like beta-propeller repeat protein [Halovivax cerinus]|uniref:PQQ-binding-like beta-propeller repeat protein n=1 Tax=Halovivax cerinus TaxID=1487865 RepID=A0ABD5NRL6_9EURY|nr:PQQ-binding-like beta-propeller repeat protein [Halovivax cerinus]